MKKVFSVFLFLCFMVISGCSTGPSTPQDQLKDVSKMLSQGYEMSVEDRQQIDVQVNKAKELVSAGKNDEAGKILAKVLADLEVIAETDRFNKSE